MTEITEDELQKAIREALTSPAPGFLPGETTAPAEARKHKISESKARRTLEDLMARGVVEPHKVIYTDPWGDSQRVKGYRLVKP